MTDEMTNVPQIELERSRFSVRAKVIVGAVLMSIVLISGIVLAVILAQDDPKKPPTVADRATDMCQDAVLDALKAPATAEFVGTPVASNMLTSS